MYRTIMSFLGAAILCFLVVGGIWGERETADAAVISVSPANVEGNIGEDDETTKTLQEIINDDATYVGAQDVLNFAPGEYEDVGELLVTRPLTLRKAPGSAGDAKFTGKVMINIKSDDVVVDGLTFMDVTVPDIVTIEVDRDPGTDGNQPIRYGFPGKTLAEFFKERLSNQQVLNSLKSSFAFNQLDDEQIRGYFRRSSGQLPSPIDAEDLAGLELTAADMKCTYDYDDEEGSGIIYDLTDDSECTELTYNNELWVTVAGSSTAADNGQIANQHTGDPVSIYAFNAYKMPEAIDARIRPIPDGDTPALTPTIRPAGSPTEPPNFEIVEQAITSAKAKNGLGIIWVDAYAPDGTCETAEDADGREVEVAEIEGVVIRNNTFDGTEIAAVRAGDWAPPGRNGVTYVIPGDRPGSPPSYNPPLRPSLRPSLRPLTERPFCQSIQCSERVSARAYCQKELDVVANTFMNVGGAGDFLKDGNGRFLTDDDGNKIAEVGNREPAIDLGNVVRAEITDNTIDGGTWDALVLAKTPEGARINIKNNLITNTILDGIKIYGPSAPSPDTGELDEEGLHGTRLAPTAADAQSDTAIMVMGNRVTGTNMNRYITLHNGWDPTGDFNLPGTSDLPVELAYYGQRDNCFPVDEGYSEEDGDLVVWTDEGEAIANRLLAPEVWRSAVPTYTFPDTGGGVSNLNEDGTLVNDPWGEDQGNTGIGYTGLVRISAESCVTSRISVVYHQPGLSIIGNDLGYTPGSSVSGLLGSPSYGLTLNGDVALAAFSGNNIDFFNSAAVLSTTGKAISTKGNYLGVVPRVQTGATTDFAAQDARESEPLGGTADAPRVIGPRESMLNPDRSSLMLTGVEVNAAGTMITLNYNKALRENSEIDPDDFTVRACTESSDCTGRFKPIEVTGVQVSGSTVTLSLGDSPGIAEGDTVVVIYSGAGIRDMLGNAAEAITTSQKVTNNVGRSAPTDGPGTTNQPQAGGGGGGCALASAGDGGANPGMLLPFMLAGLAFCVRRRRVGARRS